MPFCKDCDQHYITTHNCPPVWECRVLETLFENEWRETNGRDAELAATRFCELRDRNGDYDIIQAGGAEIEVRKPGTQEVVIVDVRAEGVPQYYGMGRKPRTDQQKPREEPGSASGSHALGRPVPLDGKS